MDSEKETKHKTFIDINKLSRHHNKMLVVSLFLIVACVIFDIVPYHYCNELIEKIFTREDYMGNVIAVIVAIWTFMISLSIYSLERMGARYYGISMSDILIVDIEYKGLVALAGMVSTELLALILAAIFNWVITVAMIAVQQFLIMIYLFWLVCVKTSYDHFLEQVCVETERCVRQLMDEDEIGSNIDVTDWSPMLFKMVRNLDYAAPDSVADLLKVLNRYSGTLRIVLQETEESKDKGKLFQLQKKIIEMSKYLVFDILYTAKTKDNIGNILNDWLKTGGLMFEIKQGIIAALFEELTPQNASIYQDLIKSEFEYQRELQIWGAVYNVYLQDHIDEEWRTTYTERLFGALYINWKKEDAKLVLKYWKYAGGEQGIYMPIFKYIFRSGKMEVL